MIYISFLIVEMLWGNFMVVLVSDFISTWIVIFPSILVWEKLQAELLSVFFFHRHFSLAQILFYADVTSSW